MRDTIINAIEQEKLIVIVRGIEREKLIPLAEAMHAGGVRLLEVTYSANGAVSDEDTAENIRILCEHFGDRMYIGAGTVLKPEQVDMTKAAGGQFIISPDAYDVVIKRTRELEAVLQIPNVEVWSPSNPKLYTLLVKTETDCYEETFGVRKIEVTDKGFFLNGQPFYMKGFGIKD